MRLVKLNETRASACAALLALGLSACTSELADQFDVLPAANQKPPVTVDETTEPPAEAGAPVVVVPMPDAGQSLTDELDAGTAAVPPLPSDDPTTDPASSTSDDPVTLPAPSESTDVEPTEPPSETTADPSSDDEPTTAPSTDAPEAGSPPSKLSVSGVFPKANTVDADVETNLVITFKAPVQAGSGTLEVVDVDQMTTVESFLVSDPRVQIDDATVTIDLQAALQDSTGYSVSLPQGAFLGVDGELFGGLSWTFHTVTVAEPEAVIPGGVDAADLFAWFDAADADKLTLASSAVAGWVDKAGHGNNLEQLTVAKQPLLVPDALGGKPVVRFDGTDDFLLGPDLTDPTAYDLFVVWRSPVAAATDFVVMLSNGVLDTCNFQLTHGHTVADARHAAVSAFAGDYLFVSFDDPVADTAALWNVSYDSTVGMTAFTNGLETDTAAPLAAALDAASERFALGGSDQGEFNFTGDIGEVLLYSRSLDSTERELVQDYLAGKWGLTLGE